MENMIFKCDQTDLEKLTVEILELKNNMIDNTILLGLKLLQAKENCGRGEWLHWLEEKVDFTARTAQKFMKISKEYSNTKTYSYLGSDKLYKLIDLPSIEREQFILDNNVEEMSCRELTKSIKIIKDNKKAIKKAKIAKVEVVEAISTEDNIEVAVVEVETDVNSLHEITKNDVLFKPNAQTVDTVKVLQKADDLIEEIKIRTGSFSINCNSWEDINCDDRGGVLAQLYATDVITEQELIETVREYNIDLEINYKELLDGTLKEKYLNKVYNDYFHFGKDNSKYLNVLSIEDFEYEDVTDFTGWEDNEFKEDCVKSYKVEKKELIILGGYDGDGYLSLCVYKNKKLLGHYLLGENWNPLEDNAKEDLLNNIKGLEKLEHIELEGLYMKWFKQYVGYYKREEKRNIIESAERAKRKQYEEKKNEFNTQYSNYTTYKFEDIYDENCRIKDYKKYSDNSKQYMDYLKRESAKYDSYKSYDFGGMLGTTTIKEEEKPTYKKFYKTLALNFHPDKIGGDGTEMQIINNLKKNWGI
ncbi:MAG: hypothetical protein ACI8WT_001802 [Clostridium sp.]|jgi:hypothetical protein